MTTIFLDTVGLLATWDQSDQWHTAADAAFALIQKSGANCVTTTFILLECGNAAARRPYRGAVGRLREALEIAGGLIRPTEDDWSEAWQSYARGDRTGAGIVDHVSFTVMRRLGIQKAFTNDRHFAAAGFETLF